MIDAPEYGTRSIAAGLPDIGWLPSALLLIGRDGKCLSASQGAAEMLHTTRNRLLGSGWSEYFHDAEANILWIASITSDQGGGPALDLRSCSTPRRTFRLTFKLVPGHSDLLSVSLIDTTHERAAEANSLHNKTLLDRVQSISATGYWTYEVAAGRVVWSDRVFEIHGLEPSPDGVDIEASIAAYHPDDRQKVREGLAHSIQTGESFEWELRIVRKDGSIRHVIAKGEVDGGHNDATRRLFGVFQDVTEERERALESEITQERLKLVVQASRDGVWDWQFGSDEVFYSNRFKEILGLRAPGNTMSVEQAKSLIHPEDAGAYSDLIQRHLAGDERCEAEIRLRQPDGSYRWADVKAVAAFNADGEATRIVGTVGDITARKQADEVLRQARLDAVQASDAKSDFVATVSHELRTPLNGVIGMLDLLSNSNLTAEQEPLAETATDSARSLLTILDDLLDFSKLGAKRIDLNPSCFDPREHMQGVIKLFTPVADKKNVGLSVSVDDALPGLLVADHTRLRQILANLVGNAVKFTREGTVSLHAKPSQGSDGRNQIRYSVTDTGIGISEGEREHLFQPYSQGGSGTFEAFGGTGLGLAICKQLAECMGGTIGVDSRPGKGSAFWFTIDAEAGEAKTPAPDKDDRDMLPDSAPPRSAEPAPIPVTAQPAPESRAPDNASVASGNADDAQSTEKKPHLLIAEDNAVNQRVITAMVSRLGYTFDIVDDGVEAVEAVRAKTYDAVLMDIQMPRLDGVMATRLIREEERDRGGNLPIIAITAHAMRGTRDDYVAAGMTDFIAKPIEVKTLALTLKRLCNSDGGAAPENKSDTDATTGA